ncbi:hypothetical protein RUM43_000152 [Polyplax serrata]|uniref:Uncharacterized protein n=1 Tax=Polyplax serrata TaxID=468196 RepID=A0AAN8XRR0_POLSC
MEKRIDPVPVKVGSDLQNSFNEAMEQLKQQNKDLLEALSKIQKTRTIEKKYFHEILFGIDKALSTLPIRLEKIRVRNQKNLCMINSTGFQGGDAEKNKLQKSENLDISDGSLSYTQTSQDSEQYMSTRMRCLLDKIEQMNVLLDNMKRDEASTPIELLLSSELYAISLLKKEVRNTKKQIEENKTDTETARSTDCPTGRDVSVKDSHLKGKNSFKNELDKASNFKIFENHMIIHEEALNLLTRKIGETEGALKRKTEETECLQRENEAMGKEIFILKSALAGAAETIGVATREDLKFPEMWKNQNDRPYRLIKDLKAKLDDQEKNLCAWRSKFARLNSASSNKTTLLKAEKKKNLELESMIEILKHDVRMLSEELSKKPNSARSAKGSEKNEKNFAGTNQRKCSNWKETDEKQIEMKLNVSENKNLEFFNTLKEVIRRINQYKTDKEVTSGCQSSYGRAQEILKISSADLNLWLNLKPKNANDSEIEKLFDECKTIVDSNEVNFSTKLSAWLLTLIETKLLCSEDNL